MVLKDKGAKHALTTTEQPACVLKCRVSPAKMRRRTTGTDGEVAERLNALVLKTSKGL